MYKNSEHMQISNASLDKRIGKLLKYCWKIKVICDKVPSLFALRYNPKKRMTNRFSTFNKFVFFPDAHAPTLISLFLFIMFLVLNWWMNPKRMPNHQKRRTFGFCYKNSREKKCYTFAITFVTFPFSALTEPCFIVSVGRTNHVHWIVLKANNNIHNALTLRDNSWLCLQLNGFNWRCSLFLWLNFERKT